MENEYLVQWSIEVTAENPEDAARQALSIQRDRNSVATLFEVSRILRSGSVDILEEREMIDLEERGES